MSSILSFGANFKRQISTIGTKFVPRKISQHILSFINWNCFGSKTIGLDKSINVIIMLLFFYRCLEIPLPLLQEWWWNVSDYLFYRNVCLRDTYFLPRSSYWTIFGFWWSHHGWTIGTNASRLVLVNNHSTVDPQMSQK